GDGLPAADRPRRRRSARRRRALMPELPEVETVRRGLEPVLAGRVLERATILDGRLTAPDDPLAVALELDGERFLAVDRRGKYLLFRFHTGRTLVSHLRMTGTFLYSSVS